MQLEPRILMILIIKCLNRRDLANKYWVLLIFCKKTIKYKRLIKQRFFDTYFARFPGKYFSGDGCKRDEDGYYWITGRVDDVIIVSGHNLGTAEIEGAIGGHPAVAEAAVVGYPHDIKGNAIYAFVTLRTGQKVTDSTRDEIIKKVRSDIGPHASPGKIQFTDGLPKTRSGKIMRRILRSIACDEIDDLGDTSTLADPGVVDSLVKERI